MGPDEKDLDEALRALARAGEDQGAPARVEDAVMREWHAAHGRQTQSYPERRLAVARRPAFAAAAAALILGLGLGGRWALRDVEPQSAPAESVGAAGDSSWSSYDMLARLDPDPDSLQIVRLRVASETLRTQGYAVSDPDGDGTVEIEMVLGSDGMARSVLVTSAHTPMN